MRAENTATTMQTSQFLKLQLLQVPHEWLRNVYVSAEFAAGNRIITKQGMQKKVIKLFFTMETYDQKAMFHVQQEASCD